MRIVMACECGAAIHVHGPPDEAVLQLWRSLHAHDLGGHGPCSSEHARLVRYAGRNVERKTHALDPDSPEGRAWPLCGGYGSHVLGGTVTCELCLARLARQAAS